MKDFAPDFLIIPYQLVRDTRLEPNDRLVYALVYWFEHLKDGKCIASNNAISDILGITSRSVQNSLTNLESNGYIERTYKDDAKRNRERIMTKVAFKFVRNVGDRQKTSEMSVIRERNADDTASEMSVTRTIIGNKNTKKEPAAHAARFTTLGADVIKEFESVDPKNKGYYSNKTQRAAADFLVAEYGFDQVKKVISWLPRANKIPYFPTITTPAQLRDKWVQLHDAIQRERGKQLSGKKKPVIV